MQQYNRRTFLNKAGVASAMLSVAGMQLFANPQVSEERTSFTILFQGDSITDGNRGRDDDPNHILGHGYAFAIASSLGAAYPERKLRFINKGISGNTVADLLSRWVQDTIDQNPNVVSILAGINDVQRCMHSDMRFPADEFEGQYEQLIKETKRQLPSSSIVLGEPFILPVGMVMKDLKRWNELVSQSQSSLRKLSKAHGLTIVPYQSTFEKACKRATADYWIWDGIHPTYAGHGLMAKLWLDVVRETHKNLSL